MKILSVNVLIAVTVLILGFQDPEVSSQSLYPYRNQAPIVYGDKGDDDYGMLLAILLLAARNRGGCGGSNCGSGCCGCCNCGNSGQNIPIPYPIPFPTNNPIIRSSRYYDRDDDDDDDDDDKTNKGTGGKGGKKGKCDPSQTINVITEDEQLSSNTAIGGGNSSSSSGSSSGSSSASGSGKKSKG